MMKTIRILGLGPILGVLLAGCGTAPDTQSVPSDADRVLNDWQKVFTVQPQDGRPLRHHVGYVHRQYTETDPDGIAYVLDVAYKRRGFVLATGQAYAFEVEKLDLKEKKYLGNYGYVNGVKNVLGLSGTLEFEPVAAAD